MKHPELYRAVDEAIESGWRAEHIEELLRGPARDGDGLPVACCSACLKPGYLDGLIATERRTIEGATVHDGELCPQCLAKRNARGTVG